MFRFFRRPDAHRPPPPPTPPPPTPPPPTPSVSGKVLANRAHELRKAKRAAWVKAHCAQLLASIPPKHPSKQEPAE